MAAADLLESPSRQLVPGELLTLVYERPLSPVDPATLVEYFNGNLNADVSAIAGSAAERDRSLAIQVRVRMQPAGKTIGQLAISVDRARARGWLGINAVLTLEAIYGAGAKPADVVHVEAEKRREEGADPFGLRELLKDVGGAAVKWLLVLLVVAGILVYLRARVQRAGSS